MIIKRIPPANLKPSHLKYFEHEFSTTIPQIRISKYYCCLVTHEGELISLFPFNICSRKKLSLKEKIYVLSFIPSLDLEYDLKNKNYLFAFDQWSSGYFHWLLDTIPRIYIAIMKHSNLILLLPSELNKDLYIDSLKPFSLSDIKFIKKKGAILLRKTIYPKPLASSGNYNPDIIKNIRAIYHNHFAKGEYVDCLERIYISRSRAERRRILNEDKVFEILTRKGFTIIYAENLTFSDQCKLAMKTQVLVSNHGAGLSNMLFMNSGGKVMEIRNSSDSHNNCYFSLASALDLNYYYILADPTKKEAIPHHADLIIDEISFENQIDFMLNDKLL